MKITLITCPQYGVLHPPLSLAYLAVTLKNRGHEVMPLDFSIQLFHELSEREREIYWDLNRPDYWWGKGSIENIVKKERINSWVEFVVQTNPDIVGFSVYTTNLLVSLVLAEKIKEKNKQIKIIFGGPFVRRDNHVATSIMGYTYVDAVVIGEGEEALEEITGSCEKNGEIKYCKGAMIKLNGEVIDCGVRPPNHDLNSLPFPDFSDFKFDIYKESLIPLLASRGCLYNCAFCNEKSFWQDYRYRSADNVVEEIKLQILNYGITAFRFNDLMLNGNLSELEKFCDRVIQEGIKITWSGYITVRKMDRRLVEKMKRSGCNLLFVGIESGSQNILDKFKKGVKVEVAEELLRLFAAVGILVHTGWIVGFPDESFSDFKQTIDFIKRNRKYMDCISPPSLMTIPPGSPIFKNPIKFGVKHIVHAGEWLDNTTTLKIRQARINYFNKYIVPTEKDSSVQNENRFSPMPSLGKT